MGQGCLAAPSIMSSTSFLLPGSPISLGTQPRVGLHCSPHRQGLGHSRFAPIRDSMRSRRLWRSRWTMKSSRDRMRKEEMQLTMRRIPLAMESNRLFPSVRGEGKTPLLSEMRS